MHIQTYPDQCKVSATRKNHLSIYKLIILTIRSGAAAFQVCGLIKYYMTHNLMLAISGMKLAVTLIFCYPNMMTACRKYYRFPAKFSMGMQTKIKKTNKKTPKQNIYLCFIPVSYSFMLL